MVSYLNHKIMKTNPPLNKKLNPYSAFALMILSGGTLESQIVYTDLDPDEEIKTNEIFYFDLNNDAVDDFTFINFSTSNIFTRLYFAYGMAGNGVAGFNSNIGSVIKSFASALNSGDIIGSNLNFYNNSSAGVILWANNFYTGTYGAWDNVSNKFVGLRLHLDGNDYYGWARLDVTHTSIKIEDYAYNTVPDQPITAGSTVAIQSLQNNFNPVIITDQKNLIIKLNDNINEATVHLFNISGNLIFEKNMTNNISAEIPNITPGIYIIKIDAGNYMASQIISFK